MARVQLFIDGFNLYHAIAGDIWLRPYKWLDFHALAMSIISKNDTLNGIFFFTAFYPGNLEKRKRHETFIKAQKLFGVTPILGDFRKKDKYCKTCRQTSVGYEEKQTDVSIAILLFKNAVLDQYDKALLLTNDSDLIPAIRAVKEVYPNKTIKMVFPPGRAAAESLKAEADEYMRMKEAHLRQFQFPNPIIHNGVTIYKPTTW